MDIDQIIAENRCWDCKCELYCDSDDEDEWRCENCPEIYYSCKQCEEKNGGHPVSADCETLSEGGYCNDCKRHFCDHHWQQRTDNLDDDDCSDEEISIYDPPLCLECFLKKREKVKDEKEINKEEGKMSDLSSDEE